MDAAAILEALDGRTLDDLTTAQMRKVARKVKQPAYTKAMALVQSGDLDFWEVFGPGLIELVPDLTQAHLDALTGRDWKLLTDTLNVSGAEDPT